MSLEQADQSETQAHVDCTQTVTLTQNGPLADPGCAALRSGSDDKSERVDDTRAGMCCKFEAIEETGRIGQIPTLNCPAIYRTFESDMQETGRC